MTSLWRQFPLLAALLVVLVGPILLRPKDDRLGGKAQRTVIIVTPHNESIRYEFGRAFTKYYREKTGESVAVDFRTPGGTSEITRYIDGGYVAAFQNYWQRELKRPWNAEVAQAFLNPEITLPADPATDTLAQQARRAFLGSKVSCQLDLFFGGGAYDFQVATKKGLLVDCGFVSAHPEIFGTEPGKIPAKLSGEDFYDPKGCWIGNVISSFGIVYNTDVLKRLDVPAPPKRWADLADPRYFREVALANPTQSGSINKAFEMVIQQEIATELAERKAKNDDQEAIAAGWMRALRLLQRIGANARYYTDSSTKPSLDVGAGDCAAGMTIDFYGRFQAEAVTRSGGNHLKYVNAEGGTSVGVDPIGLLRGAPNGDVAREFIAFVMSDAGQKLWNWLPGTEGGPEHYALRRLPVKAALYGDEWKTVRSDPDVRPYELAREFEYHGAWTGPLFGAQAFIIRAMCIDSHEELTAAWKALVDAGFPPEATAEFHRLDHVSYAEAGKRIRPTASSKAPKIDQVRLAKELADTFRAQYRRTVELAMLAR